MSLLAMLTNGSATAVLLAALLVALAGCTGETSVQGPNPQVIVDRARAVHGSDRLDDAVVEFDLRGEHFTIRHEDGRFAYTRTYTDSTGACIREVMASDTLYRTADGVRQDLTPQERRNVETDVNSVVYFALLPHALNDPAVKKRYLGATTIEGAPYHKIEVTFRQEGGGRDWQDRFVYWIHREDYTIDYLAYYYHTDGGGSRFRRAVDPRTVEGVRFVDYVNYTAAADTLGTAVQHYDALLAAGGLEEVSEIRKNDVEVRLLE